MKLSDLQASKGSRTNAWRKGRGHGSGNGKTAGRGHKGQKSRSGGGVRIGFEGGQMPLYRRMPKRGFNNKRFANVYAEVNVSQLDRFDDNAVIDVQALLDRKIIREAYDGVVILGKGEVNKKFTVKATRFSKSAAEKITAAGGKVEVV